MRDSLHEFKVIMKKRAHGKANNPLAGLPACQFTLSFEGAIN